MNAVAAAYTAAINQYLRAELKYGKERTYIPSLGGDGSFSWDFQHHAPGGPPANRSSERTRCPTSPTR